MISELSEISPTKRPSNEVLQQKNDQIELLMHKFKQEQQ